MTARASLDKAGRIVLPKPVRDKLRLQPGDNLAVETADDSITLRPIRPQSSIRKKRGIWVYHGQLPNDSIVDLIDQVREERTRELAG